MPGLSGAVCQTTKIDAGRSGGRQPHSCRIACIPPMLAPIRMMSCPCMVTGSNRTIPRLSREGNEDVWSRRNLLDAQRPPPACIRLENKLSEGESVEIKRIGSRPSGKGPADWFTGSVRIDPLVDAPEPARVAGASVTFEPGARTAWHTHPLGQHLIVIAGCGWVQRWGGAREEIRPGDVVWIPPGEKHWHGATATTAMTHFAVQEKQGGKAVEWMEKVS